MTVTKAYNPVDDLLRELRAIVAYWETRALFAEEDVNPSEPLTPGDENRLRWALATLKRVEDHIEAEGVANAEYFTSKPQGVCDAIREQLDKINALLDPPS